MNVHDFYDHGKTMISKMVEGEIFKFSFTRKDKVRTLACANSVKLPNSEESIDPCLLFERLLVVASTSSFDVNELSKYELSAYRTAIFVTTTMLRQADKPLLATAIYNKVKHQFVELFEESAQHRYVLDGGSLLHRVQWKQSSPYTQIAESYANIVLKHYGNAMVVFDNYESSSTKDITHIRGTCGKVYPEVHFSPNMLFKGKKDHFLSNLKNKRRLINLIRNELKGCNVTYSSKGDADVDIVKTTLKASEFIDTTLVGEDTDLLILLLSLYSQG